MNQYLSLPLLFLRFWFIEAPKEITAYFFSLNKAFLQLFSLSLLLNTYFKPIKNEYREGLVGFSIGMGILLKTCLITTALGLLLLLVIFEFVVIALFVLFPFLSVYVLFL